MEFQHQNRTVKVIINNILKKQNFESYAVKVDENKIKGNGYLGIIFAVTIRGISTDKRNVILNVILKVAPENVKLRENFPIHDVFRNENFVYEYVHPIFRNLQRNVDEADRFNAMAFHYETLSDESLEGLALEDLKESDYDLWNRKIPMNVEHVKLVLNQYGKLHALSYYLRDKQPEVLNKIEREINSKKIFEKFDEAVGNIVKEARKLKQHLDEEKEKKAIEYLERFEEKISNFIRGPYQEIDEYSVLLHGDCWCNNMMFKYEGDSKPKKVCLIDWQISRFASPLQDFCYFFYSNSEKAIIENDVEYLKYYYASLSDHLKRLGCEGQKLFSWEKCLEHWKKNRIAGLMLAMMIVRVMLSDEDEVPDIVGAAESDRGVLESFSYEIKNEAEYIERMKFLLYHFVNNNYTIP